MFLGIFYAKKRHVDSNLKDEGWEVGAKVEGGVGKNRAQVC